MDYCLRQGPIITSMSTFQTKNTVEEWNVYFYFVIILIAYFRGRFLHHIPIRSYAFDSLTAICLKSNKSCWLLFFGVCRRLCFHGCLDCPHTKFTRYLNYAQSISEFTHKFNFAKRTRPSSRETTIDGISQSH